jgi:cyclopropane-fatty-acyl-phospholipid synthase
MSNIGPHYAQTLREWRRRFIRNFGHSIESALRLEHPEMDDEDVEVFKRKWICALPT